jgi:hypothetical protein
MTDDFVKRLRAELKQASPFDRKYERPMSWDDAEKLLDRIEELNRAVLDLAQYVSSADLGFYIEPETKKVLNEIGEKKDD